MEHFETLLKETLNHLLSDSTPVHLAESIRYSLLAPGKRIRPRLLLACSEMLNLAQSDIMPAALAIEMIHCFTLIHDDLPCMDNDDFRRGLPSNHKKFSESLALLAGDGLIALAIDSMMKCPIEPTRLLNGIKRLPWAMGPRGVIGGQAAESLLNDQSTLDDLRLMHRGKTGALFSAALLIPKDLAGISDESDAGCAISSFADELGLAFQMADDLEDADPNTHSPTSILFYMSAENAVNTIQKGLSAASDQLIRIWGEKASPLRTIATEVIRKAEKTLK